MLVITVSNFLPAVFSTSQHLAEKVKLSQLEPHIWTGVDKGTSNLSFLGFCYSEWCIKLPCLCTEYFMSYFQNKSFIYYF